MQRLGCAEWNTQDCGRVHQEIPPATQRPIFWAQPPEAQVQSTAHGQLLQFLRRVAFEAFAIGSQTFSGGPPKRDSNPMCYNGFVVEYGWFTCHSGIHPTVSGNLKPNIHRPWPKGCTVLHHACRATNSAFSPFGGLVSEFSSPKTTNSTASLNRPGTSLPFSSSICLFPTRQNWKYTSSRVDSFQNEQGFE